jgi:Outer membrane protein beta-barrel domain
VPIVASGCSRTGVRLGGVVLCLFLLGTLPLKAQTPRAEISGGYSFMHDYDRSEDFPVGWVASATGNINGWIGVATEAGGSYRTCENCQRGPFTSQNFRGTDLHLRVYTYLAGPRFASRAIAAVTPFAQILFGGSHMSGGTQFDGALNTGFTYQPGGGVDVRVTPRAGIRLEGDYRVIRTSGHDTKQSRVLVGVVFRYGQL